jgi:hypothetical protein
MKNLVLMLCVSLWWGCQSDARASRERGPLNVWDGPQVVKAPVAPRCASKSGGARKRCDEAEFLAITYVRRLAALDPICVEGGVSRPPSNACQVRGNVVDTGNNRLLVEILEARAGTKWFSKEGSQFWFEEGALVDFILAEDGY